MKRLGHCALLTAAILAAGPLAAQDRPLLALDDFDKIADLSSTSLSPDGSRVAFIVSHVDRAADVRRSEVAVVSTKGGEPRIIAKGEVAAPAWSPDGQTLAWIAGKQLHLAARDTLGAVRTLDADPSIAGIQSFAWSPDGRSMAYLAKMDVVRNLPDKSFEFADADYLGTTFLARDAGAPPTQLWIVDTITGERRRLEGIKGYPQDVIWQADGRALAVQVQPGGSSAATARATLLSVPIDGTAPLTLMASPAQMGTGSRLDVASDGAIAFQHFRGIDPWTHANSVGVYRSGKVEILSQKLDQQIDAFQWLPGAEGLVARAVEHNRDRLWSISSKGAVAAIDLGAVNIIGGLDVGANGAISFVGSSAERTADLYYLASTRSKPVRLTRFGDALAAKRLAKVERVTWAAGGLNHDGVIIYPPDYDRTQTYPLLVDIHGGPEASSTDAFDFSSQYNAANGWIVFQPNYRGSTGQGDHYQAIVADGDTIKGAAEDVMAGIDRLVATLPIDPKRVAVTGYSWGGVMTSWLIGHDQRWCAAIPGGLVVDFAAYYDQSAFAIWMPTVKGSPHVGDNIQKYREISPLTYLGNAITPTMVIHNAGDPNAPVTQALTLYHFLKEHGVKTRMVLRAIDSHDFGSPFDHKQMYDLPLKWMTENCGAGGQR